MDSDSLCAWSLFSFFYLLNDDGGTYWRHHYIVVGQKVLCIRFCSYKDKNFFKKERINSFGVLPLSQNYFNKSGNLSDRVPQLFQQWHMTHLLKPESLSIFSCICLIYKNVVLDTKWMEKHIQKFCSFLWHRRNWKTSLLLPPPLCHAREEKGDDKWWTPSCIHPVVSGNRPHQRQWSEVGCFD